MIQHFRILFMSAASFMDSVANGVSVTENYSDYNRLVFTDCHATRYLRSHMCYDDLGRVASSACDGFATKFTYGISSLVTGAAGDFFDDNNRLFIPVKYFLDIQMREAISICLSALIAIPLKIDPNSNLFASNRYQMSMIMPNKILQK